MKRSLQQGFTLAELVVTLLIIGVVVAFVSVSFSARHEDRNNQLFGQRLFEQLRFAAQQAILQPGQYGFALEGRSYQFYRLSEEDEPNGLLAWLPLTQHNILGRYDLPGSMVMTLETDNSILMSLDEDAMFSPLLQFYSSGDITPFILTVSHTDNTILRTIMGNMAGEITQQ